MTFNADSLTNPNVGDFISAQQQRYVNDAIKDIYRQLELLQRQDKDSNLVEVKYNGSGSVPHYGVVELDTTTASLANTDGNLPLIPTTLAGSNGGAFFANSVNSASLGADDQALAYSIGASNPVQVLYEGTVAVGDTVGVDTQEYRVKTGGANGTFKVVSSPDTALGTVWVILLSSSSSGGATYELLGGGYMFSNYITWAGKFRVGYVPFGSPPFDVAYANTGLVYVEDLIIEPGATIDNVVITAQSPAIIPDYAAGNQLGIDVNITMADVDSVLTPENFTYVNGLARTSSNVAHNYPDTNNFTPPYPFATPNLALLLQEVIDRPGWASGNNVLFYLSITGATSTPTSPDDNYFGCTEIEGQRTFNITIAYS